jgi:replication factor C subunit 3/5
MSRVDATEGGKNAILALADGDLRRVLNLLQSTAMAYPQVTRARGFVVSCV